MNKLERIYQVVTEHRGIVEQIKHFYEELKEFEEELNRMVWEHDERCRNKLTDEAGDLINMILQIVLFYGGNIEDVMDGMESKMLRELGLFNNEK